jgi:predicted nucleic acid-binding protein
MSVFVDSSAFVALFEEDDEFYTAARATWNQLLSDDVELRTSSHVVPETAAVLQRRSGMQAARAFLLLALPLVQVDWVTPEVHAAAVPVFLALARRDVSLVDCVSFELMRQLGIETAFTFDPHFGEQGFQCVPGLS